MNEQLKSYYGWFDANKLSNNASKTNYMIFHKPRQVIYDNELLINVRPLQRVTNTIYLGAFNLPCPLKHLPPGGGEAGGGTWARIRGRRGGS